MRVVIGFVGLLAIALTSGAHAADLNTPPLVYKGPAPPPPLTWEGFYFGANGGYSWGSSCWTFIDTSPSGLAGPPANEGCHRPSGALVGGQLGYNWQIDQWVIGPDIQGDWAALQGQNVSAAFPTTTNRTRADGIGLFTGRLGYAAGPALFYAKGGAAIVQNSYDFFGTLFGAPASGGATQNRWGATAGAGREYKFAQHWSAAIEYDFVALGNSRLTFATSLGVGALDDVTQNLNMVTGRINYAF
jgi:outer membrane immunogenic protein